MVENLFESTTPGIPRGEKWPLQSENVPNFAGEPNLHPYFSTRYSVRELETIAPLASLGGCVRI